MNNDWLDIGVLEDYLDGKLDAKTMNRVEREALEDPFVAEALAGLSESPKRSLQSLSLLQKQLQERVAEQQQTKKRSVITWQRLSIAATAAVLFISVSIIFWMKENTRQAQMAKQSKSVEVNLAPEKVAPVVPVVSDSTGLAKAKPAEEKTAVGSEIDAAIAAAKTNAYARNNNTVLPGSRNAQVADIAAAGISADRVMPAQAMKKAVTTFSAPDSNKEAVFSGKVAAQSDGQPLPGVTVRVEGTSLTTVTNANGEFRIAADTSVKADKIKLNYIGFESKELTAQLNKPMAILLKENHQTLNEVVVASASGVRKKSADTSIGGALSGRMAGVVVSEKEKANVPMPVGGWDKFGTYLKENNKFKAEAQSDRFVELRFTIDKDGRPADIKVLKSLRKAYDDEAIRLLSEGPKWEPARRSKVTYRIGF